jgi:hypothetical protein
MSKKKTVEQHGARLQNREKGMPSGVRKFGEKMQQKAESDLEKSFVFFRVFPGQSTIQFRYVDLGVFC